MQALGTQAVAVVLVLAIVLGPGWIGAQLLYRRKKLERQRRRSPLTQKLLRAPGHTLRVQLEEGRTDQVAELVALMFLPALLLALLYVVSLVTGRAHPTGVLALTGAAVVAFAVHQTRKRWALPGWFVDRKGRGPVLVLSGDELGDHLLKARDARPLSEEQVKRVTHQVEQRCRDVAPIYRPVDEVG